MYPYSLYQAYIKAYLHCILKYKNNEWDISYLLHYIYMHTHIHVLCIKFYYAESQKSVRNKPEKSSAN